MTRKPKAATPVGKTAPKRKAAVALSSNQTRKKGGKAVAKAKEPKAAIMETLYVPGALLLAGEAIAAKVHKDAMRLHGVFIHQVDEGRARVVARDNARLFVASFPITGTVPSWLKDGLMLYRDNLKTRVSMLTKVEGSRMVAVSHAAKTSDAELSDVTRSAVMKVMLNDARSFPAYDRVMTAASFSAMDFEGEVSSKDWQSVGFSSRSLKHCAEIAKILEGGLVDRPPEGMVIRAFNGNENAPKVFDFPQWPGALLVVEPIPAGALPIAAETSVVLAPAAKLTVAALRAHAKRWIQRADATEDEAEKKEHLARAANFTERVDVILARAPAIKQELLALEGGEAAAAEPEPEEVAMPSGTDRKTETVH